MVTISKYQMVSGDGVGRVMCFVVLTREVCHSDSSEAVIALLLDVWKLRLSEHWTIKQEVKIPTLCGRFH